MLPGQMSPIQIAHSTNLQNLGELVSGDIFHYIQTRANVRCTNVDGTNVPKKVGNSYRWRNHPTFKVLLSSDKLQWSYDLLSAVQV